MNIFSPKSLTAYEYGRQPGVASSPMSIADFYRIISCFGEIFSGSLPPIDE